MKTRFFIQAILLFSLNVSVAAYTGTQEIDGIYYELVTKSKKATVVRGSNKYEGDVVIPSTVTFDGTVCNVVGIEKQAFYRCEDLLSVTIPASVVSIGEFAFERCGKLLKVVFEGDGLTTMGQYVFSECTSLSKINIPNTLTKIPEASFHKCISLNNVVIPNSVADIGDAAFFGCTSLFSISIPESVTNMGESVFEGCTSLRSFRLPRSWTKIPSGAFAECTSLSYLVIPEGIRELGDGAFRDCSGVEELYIPSSLTDVGDDALRGFKNLQHLDIPDVRIWSQIYFGLYEDNPSLWAKEFCVNGEVIENLVIPDGVTRIEEDVFPICRELKTITIPNSVKTIGSEAFYLCPQLTTVVIGNGVQKIWDEAFGRCGELLDVYCYAEKVPENWSAFKDSYIEEATLHVPAASVNAYKDDYKWGQFGTIVPIKDGDPKAELPKCAKPKISYENGELVFTSDTPDVTFKSIILDTDMGERCTNEFDIDVSYIVKVMATREGYEPSDVSIAEIYWLENGTQDDIEVIEVDPVSLVNAGNGGIYNLAGQKVSDSYKGVVVINGKKVLKK